MTKRIKIFKVNNKTFLFDGESLQIVESKSPFLIEHYKGTNTNLINTQRANYLKTLCLVLNNSCNLCCEYCFANKGKYDNPNKQMTFNTAKKALDILLDSVKINNGKELTIAFFGGEPLLSLGLIEEIINYMGKLTNGIRCKYMITTNGTLITPKIEAFFRKNNFDVMISIDGTREKHDFYRKYNNGNGSYDDITKAIGLFKNKQQLNARITVTDNNTNIKESVKSVLSTGVKRVTFAVDYNIGNEGFNLFLNSFSSMIEDYLRDIKSGVYYDITNISSIIATIVLREKRVSHCNAGISYLTFSADGKFYRCPRFVGESKFCISETSDKKALLEATEQFKEVLGESAIKRNTDCSDCEYVYLCGGACYHHAHKYGSLQFDSVPMECIQNKLVFEETIKLICNLNTEERKNFLLFLIDLWSNYERR